MAYALAVVILVGGWSFSFGFPVQPQQQSFLPPSAPVAQLPQLASKPPVDPQPYASQQPITPALLATDESSSGSTYFVPPVCFGVAGLVLGAFIGRTSLRRIKLQKSHKNHPLPDASMESPSSSSAWDPLGLHAAPGVAASAAALPLLTSSPALAEGTTAAAEVAKEVEKAPEGLLNFGKIPLGGGFELNLDIPETGIVNIAVLIAGLNYLLGPLLSEATATREKEIQSDIDDAVAKFTEAQSRLAEAEKAQAQANEVIEEINASIEKDKKEFEQSMTENMEASLARQKAASKESLAQMEAQASGRVESYIQTESVKRGMMELRAIDDSQREKFMDMAIDTI